MKEEYKKFDREKIAINKKMRPIRRKIRKHRIKAQLKHEAYCEMRDKEEKQEVIEVKVITKRKAKVSRLEKMKKWLKETPIRRAKKKAEKLKALKEEYKKLEEEYRLANNMTKDSIIKYDPKKKSFSIQKATIKPFKKDPLPRKIIV